MGIKIEGKYEPVRYENLEAYFHALGVPRLASKMMAMNCPTMEIHASDGKWKITFSSSIVKIEVNFQLGKEYDDMFFNSEPGIMKSVTVLKENNVLETKTYHFDVALTRTYKFTEEGCLLTKVHECTGTKAQLYYRKVK